MKTLSLINLLLLIVFNVSAQISDSTCIKSRWLYIKNEKINKELFTSINDSVSILFEIKNLVENHKLVIYDEKRNFESKGEWYPIYSDDKINKNIKQFYILIQSSIPIVNVYGEDSTEYINGGTYKIYPLPDTIFINLKDLSEIRIKENRVYNSVLKKYEFEPVGISFCTNKNGNINEIFWLHFEDLLKTIQDTENLKWCNFIKNKKYYGFQYLQTSCFDNFIKY